MNNRIVAITGAGGVLCSCFSEYLAKLGYKIMLLDLNLSAAEAVAEKIRAAGGVAEAFSANVLDKTSLINVKKDINTKYGKISVLINGAGGNSPKATTQKEFYQAGDSENDNVKSFFDLDEAGIKFVFDLNCMGTLLPTQVFAVDMTETGGCIINIASMNAYRPLTKIPAYSAAKAAIVNLTEWLAVHFAKQGIRVNAIAPGFFVTAQNKSMLFNEDGTPTARTEKIINATPMGRFGEAEELLGALRFLCDNEASGFVTGVTIPVDGGFSAYSGV